MFRAMDATRGVFWESISLGLSDPGRRAPRGGAPEGAGLSEAGHPAAGIAARVAAGEREAAYAQVVEATKDSLFRFLLRMLRNEEEARDVFQDTYIRVFKALHTFRGDSSLTTWVLTVGRNTALNRIRSRKAKDGRHVPMEDPDGNGSHEPFQDAREPAATRSLESAVASLPETQREAVWLFYVEDVPLQEIASLTGRPVNTIKSDLMRARARLRQDLTDPEPRPGLVHRELKVML